MGQSNIAAGATIGSNHNSRGPDGELMAGRGFWPALCVSLKHNSKFASYTIIAKGDFPAELNIPIPFSLVNNDVSNNRLVIMPGYWLMYNMYALARNAGKYTARDKRLDKSLYFEYEFLAPDTVNEIFDSLDLLRRIVGDARMAGKKAQDTASSIALGKKLLESNEVPEREEFETKGMENSNRKTVIIKLSRSYHLFKEMVSYYAALQIIDLLNQDNQQFSDVEKLMKSCRREKWLNIGGQLIPEPSVKRLIRDIHSGSIKGWDAIHEFYREQSQAYPEMKRRHAFASLLEVFELEPGSFTKEACREVLNNAIKTREWMVDCIHESRAKDYQSEFRKMVFDSEKEMEKVIGKLSQNEFINQQKEELKLFKSRVKKALVITGQSTSKVLTT